jgi:hypothetical protein
VDDAWVAAHGHTVTGTHDNILVRTGQPVTISGCVLLGQGDQISAGNGSNVTVAYTAGVGSGSTSTGCFFYADHPANVNIHNCTGLDNGFGVWVSGFNGGGSVNVSWNRFRNINGSAFQGARGNLPHAIQLSGFGNVPGIDVEHNEIVNDPFASSVNDNINISAGGTPSSHIQVHDNYIQGAYNPDPTSHNDFSGSGIICDSGAAYVDIYNNRTVSTSNVGVSIAAGHDNKFWNNRMISSGLLPDGQVIYAQNNGAQLANLGNDPNWGNNFASNGSTGNLIGWMRQPNTIHNPTGNLSRADANFQSQPDDEYGKQTWWSDYSGPHLQDEYNERQAWASTLASNGWWVGNNYAVNPDFETGDLTGWTIWPGSNGQGASASFVETYAGAYSGRFHGTHWRTTDYEVGTDNTIRNLPNGVYTVSAWVKGSGHAITPSQLQAHGFDAANTYQTANIPATGSWTSVSVPNIHVTNGQCVITFYSHAKANEWIYFDEVYFYPQQ